jgi:hypothetical protein
MKRILVRAILVLALAGLTAVTVGAVSPGAELVPTHLSWVPQVPYPGQEVKFTLKYENQGDSAVPEGTDVEYCIKLMDAEECLAGGEVPGAVGLQAGEGGVITDTLYAPTEEDTYTLIVTLDPYEREEPLRETLVVETALPPGLAQLLAGLGIFAAVMAIMAAGTEVVVEFIKSLLGMKEKVTAMEAFNQLKAELPGQLAGLGVDEESRKTITELIKDVERTYKLEQVADATDAIVGRRIQDICTAIIKLAPDVAKEATEKKLGALKEEAKASIQAGLFQLNLDPDITDGVYRTIEPMIDEVTVESLPTLMEGVSGALQGAAISPDAVKQWLESGPAHAITVLTAGVNLNKLKEDAKAEVNAGLSKLGEQLGLNPAIINGVYTTIESMIDNVTLETASTLWENVFKELQKTLQDPEGVAEWLQSQVDVFLVEGRSRITGLLDDNSEILAGLGFDRESAKKWVSQVLDVADQTARKKTNTYALAVKNLLSAVEERRNAMQSPGRKLWRRLRDSYVPLSYASVAVVTVVIAIICAVAAWPLVGRAAGALPQSVTPFVVSLVKLGVALGVLVGALILGAALGAVAGLVVAGVVGWATRRAKMQANQPAEWWEETKAQLLPLQLAQPDQPDAATPSAGQQNEEVPAAGKNPPLGSLGHFLRHGVEQLFNWLRGEQRPPSEYGQVDPGVSEQIASVAPTTVASVLLERENKHQDEETSRIRILRVFTIIVGTVMAYGLQIDAAKYLNYAVPGIGERINAINLHDQVCSLIPKELSVGIILTGLAASAGSKFWRDLLGRLQTTREQAEEVARLVQQVKGTGGAGG